MGVFERAVGEITGHPPATLGAVSQTLRVERHTVERAFRSKTGKPFRSFRRELLLERSMELLRSTTGWLMILFRTAYNVGSAT